MNPWIEVIRKVAPLRVLVDIKNLDLGWRCCELQLRACGVQCSQSMYQIRIKTDLVCLDVV